MSGVDPAVTGGRPDSVEVSSALSLRLFGAGTVAVAWTRGLGTPARPLVTDEEILAIERAAASRRRAFLNGRAALRVAAESLGMRLGTVERGADRAPVFPPGVAGSLSHTDGMVVGAVHDAAVPWRLGIDVERAGRDLSGVVDRVLLPDERAAVASHGGAVTEMAVFSAKEAVYKAQHQLTSSWLGFEDVIARPDAGSIVFEPRSDVARRLGLRWPIVAETVTVDDGADSWVLTGVVAELA